MGFFSWKTRATKKHPSRSISNKSSGATFTVWMHVPPNSSSEVGQHFKEEAYRGYGEFGGKDYFVALSEANPLNEENLTKILNDEEHRSRGIDLAFKKEANILYPIFTEEPTYEGSFTKPCESCEFQGYFYPSSSSCSENENENEEENEKKKENENENEKKNENEEENENEEDEDEKFVNFCYSLLRPPSYLFSNSNSEKKKKEKDDPKKRKRSTDDVGDFGDATKVDKRTRTLGDLATDFVAKQNETLDAFKEVLGSRESFNVSNVVVSLKCFLDLRQEIHELEDAATFEEKLKSFEDLIPQIKNN